MESLRELYRIGRGPSSSHTMGPAYAAGLFRQAYPQADRFLVTLYGSLAKTGRGHLTDAAVSDALAPCPSQILFDTAATGFKHPNTLDFTAYRGESKLGAWRVYSVGGGKIEIEGFPPVAPQTIYPLHTFTGIKAECAKRGIRLWQYVESCEGPGIWEYLADVWRQMKATVGKGLAAQGTLPGGLGVRRKARELLEGESQNDTAEMRESRLVYAYAFAASEENAGGGTIVTAPTCGASGVVPAVMLFKQEQHGFSDQEILRALAAAGLIGNLIKTNASISGAECGCQAEIGSACSMAAAGLAELFGMGWEQTEYAAEAAMEHHLGLTCDPVKGLVQIPCIERNAMAAMQAINALNLAAFQTGRQKIPFDMVVKTMYETGRDLVSQYRETSEGGLAKSYTQE